MFKRVFFQKKNENLNHFFKPQILVSFFMHLKIHDSGLEE